MAREDDQWIYEDAKERWDTDERTGRRAARIYFEAFGFIRPPSANLRNAGMRHGWEAERKQIIAEQRAIVDY